MNVTKEHEKAIYKKVMSGKTVSGNELVRSMCYYCTQGYADGLEDCGVSACPLYSKHPFKPQNYVLKPVNTNKLKTRKGIKEYNAIMNGEYVSWKKRIMARCSFCCGFFIDEIFDCLDKNCPCYAENPYKGK